MGIDALFVNGTILAVTSEGSPAGAVAVERGRIVFVGDRVPDALANAAREKIDLEGRCLVPGFVDGHSNLASAGFLNEGIDARHASSFRELADAVRAHRRAAPRAKWVLVCIPVPERLSENRLPDRAELDEWEPERPCLVATEDGEAAAVNSAFLVAWRRERRRGGPAAAPAGAKSPAPLLGPNSADAMRWLAARLGRGAAMRGLALAAGRELDAGITCIHGFEGAGFPDDQSASRVARSRLCLQAGIIPYAQVSRAHDALGLCQREVPGAAVAVVTPANERDAAIARVFEAFQLSSGVRWAHNSVLRTTEAVDAWVWEAHRLGIQPALHAWDHGSLESAIGALERAHRRHARVDARPRIEGCVAPSADQLARLADLGAAVCTPAYLLRARGALPSALATALGPGGLADALPHRSILEAGIVWLIGGFGPGGASSPLSSLAAAVDHPNEGERVTAWQALVAHTKDAAHGGFDEAERGCLTLGRRADFAVLSHSPLAVSASQLGRIQVESTWVGGRQHASRPPRLTSLYIGTLTGRLRAAVGAR
jgi:hypothetical protein